MNVWTFTGRLGHDAQQRFTTGGDSMVNFSVAVESGFGDKKKTTWTRCAIFGKRGSALLGYLNKGTQIAVSGELTLNEYEDSDGARRVNLDVRVTEVTLLSSQARQAAAPVATTPHQDVADDLGNDLPF